MNLEFDRRAKLLYELQKRNIYGFDQTQQIINQYHKNPIEVLASFGLNSDGTTEQMIPPPQEQQPQAIESQPLEAPDSLIEQPQQDIEQQSAGPNFE